MVHYHGTPFGGSNIDCARFFQGRHACVPFRFQQHIGIVAEVCQSMMLDNSAFSAWTRGEEVDFSAYIEWVFEWHRHPAFDFAIIPDVIDGGTEENDALVKAWPSDLRGVPVYHLDEPLSRLDALADRFDRVALGSSGAYSDPGSSAWTRRMTRVMHRITDDEGRPVVPLHGLRMLDPAIFRHLPLSSADSVNASRNANQEDRFGMYCPPSSGVRADVIARRIEQYQSAARWTGHLAPDTDYGPLFEQPA
jgi:hypothetical protein